MGGSIIAIHFQIVAKEMSVLLDTVNLKWTLGMPRRGLFQVRIFMLRGCKYITGVV